MNPGKFIQKWKLMLFVHANGQFSSSARISGASQLNCVATFSWISRGIVLNCSNTKKKELIIDFILGTSVTLMLVLEHIKCDKSKNITYISNRKDFRTIGHSSLQGLHLLHISTYAFEPIVSQLFQFKESYAFFGVNQSCGLWMPYLKRGLKKVHSEITFTNHISDSWYVQNLNAHIRTI